MKVGPVLLVVVLLVEVAAVKLTALLLLLSLDRLCRNFYSYKV